MMKKTLLIGAALCIGATGFAQGNRKANYTRPVSVKETKTLNEGIATPITGPATQRSSTPKTNSACTSTRFTACVNAFAVAGGVTTYMQNCLSYNKDLNAIVWTSRMSADWPVAGTGLTSSTYGGSIQSTWLDLNTGVWDSMIIYRDSSSTQRARFPGGTIFNPAGNTNGIAGAYMVGAGSVTAGTGWIGEWVSSRQPSGNFHSVSSAQEHKTFFATGTAPFGNVGNSTTNLGFLNVDMQQVGQRVLVAGALFTPANDVEGAVLGIGTYAGNSFTWSADSSLKPPFYMSATNGLQNDAEGARIAFDPSGMVGYAVFNGRLQTTYNNSADSSMMPIVYKSTDGGLSWNLVLAGYDWRAAHPELLKNVAQLAAIYRPAGYVATHFTPFLRHGIDIAVDGAGTLHYVTTLIDPFVNGGAVDSLQYTYTYNWDYIDHHPIVWDLMTDGTCWKTLLVDSIQSSYVGADATTDSTSSFSAWSGQTAGSVMGYGAHMTVSRSSDGTKIFYGWADTDFSTNSSRYNNSPDIWVKGYDVASYKLSALVNVTNGTQTCFFPYMSDVAYFDNTANKYVAPFVWTVGRVFTNNQYASISPVDFYYNDCAKFGSADFSFPATINNDLVTTACAVGVKTNNTFVASVNNYPNPFNHTTNIVVSLNENKAVSVNVYDAIGKVVFTKTINGNIGENTIVFDGSNLNAGVYYYTVNAGYEKVTKKMVISK